MGHAFGLLLLFIENKTGWGPFHSNFVLVRQLILQGYHHRQLVVFDIPHDLTSFHVAIHYPVAERKENTKYVAGGPALSFEFGIRSTKIG